MPKKRFFVAVCTDITDACKDAVLHAKQEQRPIPFLFNGIKLTATPITKPKDLVQEYHTRYQAKQEHSKTIPLMLSKAELRLLDSATHTFDNLLFTDREAKQINCINDRIRALRS